MLFSWDPEKARANFKKHHVSFEMAQTIFDDPFHLSIIDSRVPHEERWVTIGKSSLSSTLVVVHTYKMISKGSELVRIISAREATRREIKNYEEGI